MATPVKVKLNSKDEGHLLFNNKALFYLEKESGRTFTDLAGQLSDGGISFQTLNYLIWAGLLHDKSGVDVETIDDVLDLVDIEKDEIIQGIVQGVGEALEQSLPGQNEEKAAEMKSGQKKAQGQQKKKAGKTSG